eukprot:c228_g1_i1.p1 GENE.c228_g1_i1~~c228_g1_i1.p1  ORF type:complete len:222 (-),score=42.49 c228_g1_i1:221-886(-)
MAVDAGSAFFEKGVPEHKLYIGNLDLRAREFHVVQAAKPFGNLVAIQMMWKKNGAPKGFCFIEMGSLEEATAARNGLHNMQLLGKALNVRFMDAKMSEEALGKKRTGPRARQAASGSWQSYLGPPIASATSLSLTEKIQRIERKLDIAIAGSTKGVAGMSHLLAGQTTGPVVIEAAPTGGASDSESGDGDGPAAEAMSMFQPRDRAMTFADEPEQIRFQEE